MSKEKVGVCGSRVNRLAFVHRWVWVVLLVVSIQGSADTRDNWIKRNPLTEHEDAEAKQREFPSIIYSNAVKNDGTRSSSIYYEQNNQEGDGRNYIARTKIYDINYVYYSEEFAKENNLPMTDGHIDPDMPEEMKYIEVNIITEGTDITTYLKLLLDNDLDIDVPEEMDYMMNRSGFYFVEKLKMPESTGGPLPEEIQAFRRGAYSGKDIKYNMNFNLTSGNDMSLVSKMKISLSTLHPIHFSKRLAPGLDYYKLANLGTRFNYKLLETNKAHLCFAKRVPSSLNFPKKRIIIA